MGTPPADKRPLGLAKSDSTTLAATLSTICKSGVESVWPANNVCSAEAVVEGAETLTGAALTKTLELLLLLDILSSEVKMLCSCRRLKSLTD